MAEKRYHWWISEDPGESGWTPMRVEIRKESNTRVWLADRVEGCGYRAVWPKNRVNWSKADAWVAFSNQAFETLKYAERSASRARRAMEYAQKAMRA